MKHCLKHNSHTRLLGRIEACNTTLEKLLPSLSEADSVVIALSVPNNVPKAPSQWKNRFDLQRKAYTPHSSPAGPANAAPTQQGCGLRTGQSSRVVDVNIRCPSVALGLQLIGRTSLSHHIPWTTSLQVLPLDLPRRKMCIMQTSRQSRNTRSLAFAAL